MNWSSAVQLSDAALCRVAVVVSQQAAEEALAADAAKILDIAGFKTRRRGRRFRQGAVAEPLVRAMAVVEARIRAEDVVEMACSLSEPRLRAALLVSNAGGHA